MNSHNHPQEVLTLLNDNDTSSFDIEVTKDIKKSRTRRGTACLYLHGYKFIQCSKGPAIMRYRCHRYATTSSNCHARIYIKDDRAFMNDCHNHELQ